MNETEKELWAVADQAIFDTNDPTEIRRVVKDGMSELQRLQESFGGFIYVYRLRKGLTVEEIAAQAKVSPDRWRAWEGDVMPPSSTELDELIEHLQLGSITSGKLLKLWHQGAFRSLQRLSRFQPKLRAARGVGSLDEKSEWGLLHPTAQEKLRSWAQDLGLSLPEQLFEVITELQDEDEQETWVREVWNCGE